MVSALAFIGFGEAAQVFAQGRPMTVRVFDIATRDARRAAAKQADYRRLGVDGCADSATAVAGAGVILSLVTAGAALAAVEAAAPHLAPGALWLDLNSVAPATKRAAAAAITAAGGRYVDGAIMAPVVPLGRGVPILLAGPDVAAGLAALAAAGFGDLRVVAGGVGAAAAIKLIRSVMVKGVEALTAECLAAAHRAGVTNDVLASLGPGAAERADYALDRMLAHGSRRADEMDAAVATLADLGVEPAMSRATAGWQRAVGATGVAPPAGLAAKLAVVAAAIPCHAHAGGDPSPEVPVMGPRLRGDDNVRLGAAA